MKQKKNTHNTRESIIVRTSIIGIIANVILSAFKAAVGLLSNSIAVILDAVNNLSDAASSVITIIGTKLASKAPDKKHPFGYGRIEYISSAIVAALVLYAGITSLTESIKKILHPELPSYSAVSLIIIATAVIVKLILGIYVKKKGKQTNSSSLSASGSDALFDAILSLSVLISAVIYIIWHINLEAYVGVIIAVIIIKSGIEMIRETVSDILGARVDSKLSKEVKAIIASDKDVSGAYDLIFNNYGPDRYLCSVHVEVDDAMTAKEIDAMTRRIQKSVFEKAKVIITTVGIYANNSSNDESMKIQHDITKLVMSHDKVLQMHGFYIDFESKSITFDIIIDFKTKDRSELYSHILSEVKQAYPDFNIHITLDSDISD